jgi:AraC family transcriptional regulator
MQTVSQVYEVPAVPGMDCHVKGRIALPQAVIELHHYNFRGPQGGVFSSSRCFLDLALSPRPGVPRGGYAGRVERETRPLGDVLFIPGGNALHTEWGEGEQMSICCGFDSFRMDDDQDDISDSELEASLDVRSVHVRDALLRIAREIEAPGFCSEMLVQAIWVETTIELNRYLRRSRVGSELQQGSLSRAQMQQIDELVQQPGKLPAVAELAALCGLSTRHFFRLFRAATGQTLSAYVAERRIERAKQMLGSPRPAIKMIAWECGFETSAAFSAAFRKAMGVTPKEFRLAMLH